MRTSLPRRVLGTILTLALMLIHFPTASLAGDAVFLGRVVAEDGVTPVEGVVVRLALRETASVYNSDPTAADGSFRMDTVPAGEYEVLAQDGEIGYLTAEGLRLSEGDNAPVSIVIRTGPAQTDVSEMSTWGKVAIAGTIVILILAVFDETTEEGEDNVSPF